MNKMKSSAPKLSIVIPAYNEEKRIAGRLDDLSDAFESLRKKGKIDYEILVVINNTKDKTEDIVKACQKNNKNILYLNLKQGGKGFAVIEGFKDALKRDNDFIGFVDSDLSTTGKEYEVLLNKLIGESNNYDGIIASRYIKGAKVFPKPTIQRIIASRIYNAWTKLLFFMPYADTQCGAKIFKREAVAKVVRRLIITKWAFDVDLLYNLRKLGFRIKEVPTVWSDSDYSKINFMHAGPLMAFAVLRLRLLNSPFSHLVNLYDWLPACLKLKIK